MCYVNGVDPADSTCWGFHSGVRASGLPGPLCSVPPGLVVRPNCSVCWAELVPNLVNSLFSHYRRLSGTTGNEVMTGGLANPFLCPTQPKKRVVLGCIILALLVMGPGIVFIIL
jgi:hypothetical protein